MPEQERRILLTHTMTPGGGELLTRTQQSAVSAEELLPLVYDSRSPSEELLAVNEALAGLAAQDPDAAEIVQLRYFVGLTTPEIASALELVPRTVDRRWAFARAWLKDAIKAGIRGSAKKLSLVARFPRKSRW